MDVVVSLVSGIVGALIGAYATLEAQRRARVTEQRAVARAAMIELARNVAAIDGVVAGNPITAITTAVWDGHGPLLLSALSDEEAAEVGPAYALLPRCEALRQMVDRGQALEPQWSRWLAEVARPKVRAAGIVLHQKVGGPSRRRRGHPQVPPPGMTWAYRTDASNGVYARADVRTGDRAGWGSGGRAFGSLRPDH